MTFSWFGYLSETFLKHLTKQAVSMTIVHVYENLRCNIGTYNKIRKITIYIYRREMRLKNKPTLDQS